MIKNALVAVLVAASMPAIAGTSGKAPVTPPPPAPAASSISFDYVEAAWVHGFDAASLTVINGFNGQVIGSDVQDTDGYTVGVSATLAGNLFGFANFGQTFASLSAAGINVDADALGVAFGLGYHVPLWSGAEFVIQAGAAYREVDFGFASNDEWGVAGAAGIRWALTNWLELNLFYTPSYFDETDYQNAGSANLIFRNVISNVDLVLSGSINDEFETIGAGLRYNF
ncbi:MAG: hypothetical protein JNJ83_06480 [Verrucomicrobiaceae bacterium]|nr:hypothetical protein [Verrucomicrobiaceae bacterium]